jgi:pyruvate/2-oxoglutarate dehydrogenase complex dihydrolipoamide dehydrogenase (E3) component
MSDPDFDFVVIGGGSAGYAGASTAAALGLKTAVIEGGREVGGLCILRGCMPSKTLLESGHRAEAIRRAGEFGLHAEYLGADGAAIRARKRRLIGEFAEYRAGQLASGRFEFIRGHAEFRDPHTIEVRLLGGGTRRISARAFLIATGSHLQWLDIPGLREVGCWSSDEALDAETIPASVIVLGGGAIALEAASYYAGIGSRVTIIQRGPRVLREMDADVTDALTGALEERGITVFRGTALSHVSRDGDLKTVHFTQGADSRSVQAQEIFYALGRQPATESLTLENAGVAVERGRILASPAQQCGAPHLFAAGDVCSPHEVVHIAVQQGEIAARNAARVIGRIDGELEQIDYRLKLFAVFTLPQVAAVGLTEQECAALQKTVGVATYPFADHGKSLVHGEPHGFVKLIVDRASREILGAACIGPEASELIHEIVVAMHFRATAGDLAKVPHYHPTLSEIWTYPAEELALASSGEVLSESAS